MSDPTTPREQAVTPQPPPTAGEPFTPASSDSARTMARASWLCPVIAWASQVLFQLTMRDARPGAAFFCMAALAQLALVVAGLYLGAKVLARGRASVAASTWWSALAGVVLSGGTILLVVIAGVTASF